MVYTSDRGCLFFNRSTLFVFFNFCTNPHQCCFVSRSPGSFPSALPSFLSQTVPTDLPFSTSSYTAPVKQNVTTIPTKCPRRPTSSDTRSGNVSSSVECILNVVTAMNVVCALSFDSCDLFSSFNRFPFMCVWVCLRVRAKRKSECVWACHN